MDTQLVIVCCLTVVNPNRSPHMKKSAADFRNRLILKVVIFAAAALVMRLILSYMRPQ
jgi:hypothetical protein